MEIIEFMQENFLGMSYCDQIQVIEYLMEASKECGPKRISREFNDVFEDYLEKLKALLRLKQEYPKFNSNKRRLSRKILLEKFRDLDLEHHYRYSDEEIKNSYYYSGSYYGEGKRYFDAQQVPEELVKGFLIAFSNLSVTKKREFIENMTFYYKRVNRFLELPYPDRMLEAYESIIKDLLGEDFMECYNKLYKAEQIQLILELADRFKRSGFNSKHYDWHFNDVKENPKIIRLLKKEVIDYCQSMLS